MCHLAAALDEPPEQVHVTLKVFNVLGEQVAVLVDEVEEAGYKEVKFDSRLPGGERRELPSGMYIYRLTAGNSVQSKKMLMVR